MAKGLPTRILLLLSCLCVTDVVPDAPSKTSEKPVDDQDRGGVAFLVRIGKHDAEIVRQTTTKTPRPGQLATLRRPAEPRFSTIAHQEIVLALFDRRGKLLDAYHYPGTGQMFFDKTDPDNRRKLVGLTRPNANDYRIMVTPSNPDAAFYGIFRVRSQLVGVGHTFADPGVGEHGIGGFRTSLRADGGMQIHDLRALAVYTSLSPRPDSPISLEIRSGFKLTDEVLWVLKLGSKWVLKPPPLSQLLSPATGELILDSGIPPGCAFDIVIAGDGFQGPIDQALFRKRAKVLTERLLGTAGSSGYPPFSTRKPFINVYRVDVVSAEPSVCAYPATPAAVCCCPDPAAAGTPCCAGSTCGDKDYRDDLCCSPEPPTSQTYFGVAGNHGGRCNPTYWGPPDYELLTEAADAVVGDFTLVDLWIVLVNCQEDGASADSGMRAVMMSAFGDEYFLPPTEPNYPPDTPPDYPTRLLVHEAAHAMAHLGEEDIRCDRSEPLDYLNHVHESQIGPGNYDVWWTGLAQPGELAPNGKLVYVYPMGVPGPFGKLGLFGGAQYITEDPSVSECDNWYAECPRWNDPRAAAFYRPERTCIMRDLSTWEVTGAGLPFCRVCRHVLSQAIDSTLCVVP